MAGRGPAPKPADQRRRRNATPGFKRLPHEGRSGDPPAWPLSAANAAEKRKWAKVWTLPQAVEWERLRCEHIVALYVRVFVLAMKNLDPKLLNECRQFDGLIGLSPRAMLQLRWEIDDAPEPESNGDVHVFAPDLHVFVPDHREGDGWHGSDS